MTIGLLIAVIGLGLSITGLAAAFLGLFWKVSAHVAKVDLLMTELLAERPLVRTIPLIDHRLSRVEIRLGFRESAHIND